MLDVTQREEGAAEIFARTVESDYRVLEGGNAPLGGYGREANVMLERAAMPQINDFFIYARLSVFIIGGSPELETTLKTR